jgi:hypothetical protein
MCLHAYTYLRMFVCMYVCMYVCIMYYVLCIIYVCMYYVRMYVHVHVQAYSMHIGIRHDARLYQTYWIECPQISQDSGGYTSLLSLLLSLLFLSFF